LFVAEYLKDLNATQAAIRAGYSEKTAHVQGPRLLDNVAISAHLEAAKEKREIATEIDANWVLKRLAEEADADINDLYDDETGELKPVKEWPIVFRRGLVAGVETEQLYEGQGKDRQWIGTRLKVKLDTRIKRIELIGKHVRVNAFQDQVAVTGVEALADRLARAAKRGT
jgi:phage terminase small subunit